MEGFFWNNIVTITNLKIADPVSVPPMKPVPPHEAPDCLQYQPGIHYDNFTIPLTELGWLTCTVMIVIAYYARRKNYEYVLTSWNECHGPSFTNACVGSGYSDTLTSLPFRSS